MAVSLPPFHTFTFPAWLRDAGSQCIADVNEPALQLYGYTRSEFLKLTIQELATGRAKAKRPGKDAPELSAQAGVLRQRKKAGEFFQIRTHAVPVNIDGHAGELVIVTDVTDLVDAGRTAPLGTDGADGVFAALFRGMPGRALALTPRDHIIVAATDAYLSDLNITRESIEGRPVHEVFGDAPGAPESPAWANLRQSLKRAEETRQKAPMPFLFFPKLGQNCKAPNIADRYLLPCTWPVLTPGGEVAFLIHTVDDVTELVSRHAARAGISPENTPHYLESGDFETGLAAPAEPGSPLRTAKRLLGLGIWRLNLNSRRLERSANMSGILGIPDNELTDDFADYLRIVHPDDITSVRAEAQQFLDRGDAQFRLDYRIIRPDGSVIHIETAGELTETVEGPVITGIVRDITAERDSEMKKARAEARFRLVTEATSDLIWDKDFETGDSWWNSNFARILEHAPDDPADPAEFWNDNVHPDDRERILADRNSFLESSAVTLTQNYRMQTKSRKVRWVSERSLVLRDEAGRPLRMVAGISDITEQVVLEDRVRQSERLEAIGRLTGGFAHDFNNLLTIILGNAETLADRLPDGPFREMAQLALSASESGAELIQRLMSFSRLQPLVPKPQSLISLTHETQAMVWRALPENISFDVAADENLWVCRIDGPQFQAALVNLCVNARDAMPEGGRILIEMENVVLLGDEADLHSGATAGEFVVLTVNDSGIGMSPDTLARACEPFFTTKPPGVGSGLGLSMVYGFVQQSGGSIRIYSELNAGTRVSLYFPRHVEAEPATPKLLTVAGTTFPTLHVLIVEDNERVRSHVCKLVQQLGMTVSEAGNSIEALAKLEADQQIDLLFTDIVLPGSMNGADLAAVAKSRWPRLRILFTSGYTYNAIMQRGEIDEAVPILMKPYHREELEAKLWQVLSSPPPGT
ncbi:PAS domain-containing protein [Hyphomonas sp.]|uniref:PAS domain-containing protein n=1 Tax=Hyphomonas sp. TaxID=87 RepID=UPI00391C805A